MKILAITLAAVLFAYAASSASRVDAGDALIVEKFNVANGGSLRLDTALGSVRVMSHDEPSVIVRVERSGQSIDNFTVEFEQDGNDLVVTGKKTGGLKWWNSGSVKFTVDVPREYNLELKASGGSLSIQRIDGEVDAHTSGGSIKANQINGATQLKTSGGSIKVADVIGELVAKTSGGSVRFETKTPLRHDTQLKTSGGSVTAYLPSLTAVDLSASTSGGSVSSEFDVNGKVKRTSIKGTINGGGPALDMHTSGGSVRIKRL